MTTETKTVKFDVNLAKRTKQEIIESHANTTSKAVQVASPGKKDFIRIRGNSVEDCVLSHACSITDPDGEPQTYLIQNPDDTIRQTIFEKLENKVSLKILAVCVNCFEEEFIWPVSQSATGQSKSWMASGRRAVEMAQKEWVRITWKDMANGYLCTRPINQEKYGEPSWSKLSDEELINFAYDGRIITDPDHEAIRRHLGA
jgi:hypothetical protein|tara:strand:+ start:349 stop:951 length:603 start_codon:yes stop_codon:yes gene_type:complete